MEQWIHGWRWKNVKNEKVGRDYTGIEEELEEHFWIRIYTLGRGIENCSDLIEGDMLWGRVST